jgi:hypothetical protein
VQKTSLKIKERRDRRKRRQFIVDLYIEEHNKTWRKMEKKMRRRKRTKNEETERM